MGSGKQWNIDLIPKFFLANGENQALLMLTSFNRGTNMNRMPSPLSVPFYGHKIYQHLLIVFRNYEWTDGPKAKEKSESDTDQDVEQTFF